MAWRAGDRDAGSRLFERHFELVCNFFRGKLADGVEDLIQRTFVELIESVDRFRGDASFRSYLLGIARHILFRHYREQAQGGRTFEPLVTSVCELMPSASSVIAQHDEHAALVAAMRALPVDLQIALELYFWEDLTMREIAGVLDVPQGTAASRLRRAKEGLRERLDALGVRADPPDGDDDDAIVAWARRVRRADGAR